MNYLFRALPLWRGMQENHQKLTSSVYLTRRGFSRGKRRGCHNDLCLNDFPAKIIPLMSPRSFLEDGGISQHTRTLTRNLKMTRERCPI